MKIPFTAVDTPADILFLNALLEGHEVKHCAEWDNVEHITKQVNGKVYEIPVCPQGCVKTVKEVEQKCGIKYWKGK